MQMMPKFLLTAVAVWLACATAHAEMNMQADPLVAPSAASAAAPGLRALIQQKSTGETVTPRRLSEQEQTQLRQLLRQQNARYTRPSKP